MNSIKAHYRASLQQSIDDEIKAIEESIKLLGVLKLRRNALQPISSLPPEIFAAIFSSLCLPGIPSLGGKPSRNLARLRITHVCHQWREIALHQPQLWSHINFDTINLAGATEILARAKSVPLYMETWVSGQYEDDRFGQFLNQVHVHLPHVRHLSIGTEFVRPTCRVLVNTLVSPAPALEYLSLSCKEDENRRIADEQLVNPDIQVLDTLFGGSTPRLSSLKLRNCSISWNSPFFKGLKHLEILTPNKAARPTLAIWLDTLDKIPQLKTLTLHLASPVAVRFPFDVERTVTLPSLTHLNISASLQDCALAAAHLIIPALTSLCLTAIDHQTGSGMQAFLPYVARHVHGPQDIRPLQSALIHHHVCKEGSELGFLAWPMPDFDTFVHDPSAFLGVTHSTRVRLSFRSKWDTSLEIFEIMMAALPLDGLLTLAAVDLDLLGGPSHNILSQELTIQHFWLRFLPNWPLLQHVRLAPVALRGFIKALLEDCKNPLLPSLTELALAETTLDEHETLCLRDVVMKRMEQGVPLKTLDLRMCSRDPYNFVAVQLLSEAAVDILRPLDFLGPEDTAESREAGYVLFAKMLNMWEPFLPYLCYSGDDDSECEESEDDGDNDDEHDEDDKHGNDDGHGDGDEYDNLTDVEDDDDDDDYVPDED